MAGATLGWSASKTSLREQNLQHQRQNLQKSCRNCSRSCKTINVKREKHCRSGCSEWRRRFCRKNCSGTIQELQVLQQVIQVASFAAGAAWGHLSESSFFAGIAAGCDQAQEMLQVLHRCKFRRKFWGRMCFCKFCRGIAEILTTPAAKLVKLHCCEITFFTRGISIGKKIPSKDM